MTEPIVSAFQSVAPEVTQITQTTQAPKEHSDQSSFWIELGFELISADDEAVEIACAIEARHHNRSGNAHGGLLATLLDTAMGFACRAGSDLPGVSTANLNVNFLRPAHDRVTARAKVVRRGGTLAFCEAVARERDDTIVATASGVFALKRAVRPVRT